MPAPAAAGGGTRGPLFLPGAGEGEIQIPRLLPLEPTTAQADNIPFQLQHTELRG